MESEPLYPDQLMIESLKPCWYIPGMGNLKKITDTIPLDKNLVRNIWIAKQLGLKGRTPKTDCDSRCPHHRYGSLPEGNLEPAIPLALIVAKGLVECGADLDTEYLRRYLGRKWDRGDHRRGIVPNQPCPKLGKGWSTQPV